MPLVIVAALAVAEHLAAAPPVAVSLVVIVGKNSPIRSVTMDTVRDVFLRRQRLWPDGSRAMPVNLPADSAERQAFSQRVLGRLPTELVDYWNRLYFDGIRPPLVLRSPDAACAYVATDPAAIAYVPAGAVDKVSCRVVLELPAAHTEQ